MFKLKLEFIQGVETHHVNGVFSCVNVLLADVVVMDLALVRLRGFALG